MRYERARHRGVRPHRRHADAAAGQLCRWRHRPPDFYQSKKGAVLSTAVDKYVYVTVKRHGQLFNEPIRLNYSRTEQVNSVDEIENNIARECLRYPHVEPPIFISAVGDMPAHRAWVDRVPLRSDCSTRSTRFRGERVTAGQLAEEACYIEMEVLKEPIGKQDQYAAALGGSICSVSKGRPRYR